MNNIAAVGRPISFRNFSLPESRTDSESATLQPALQAFSTGYAQPGETGNNWSNANSILGSASNIALSGTWLWDLGPLCGEGSAWGAR